MKRNKLKGSTLIEIVVAMLIASIVFFFCFSIIVKALSGNKMLKEYKGELLVSTAQLKAIKSKVRTNEEVSFSDGLKLSRTIVPDNSIPGLYRMTILLIDEKGTVIAESKSYLRDE